MAKKKCADCPKLISRNAKRCSECAAKARWRSPNYRDNHRVGLERAWTGGKYDNRKNMWDAPGFATRRAVKHKASCSTPGYCALRSQMTTQLWKNGTFDSRDTPEWHRKLSIARREAWSRGIYTEETRKKQAEALEEAWKQGVFDKRKEKHLAATPRGETHHNWRGGVSFELYGYKFNRGLKRQIRERDNYTCLVCGKLDSADVHHKDYDKKNNDPSNLATLCKSCHSKTNFDRPYWQAYFTGEGYEFMLGAF